MCTRGHLGIAAAGFTLVELMIVVVILGIMTVMGLPSFQSMIEAQRVKNAATNLYIAMTRARSEAIKRDANVTVAPTSGSWVNGWQVLDPTTNAALDEYGSASGMTIDGPGTVVYQSSGRLQGGTSASFSIVGSETSFARCVTADLGGRPNVKAGTC